MYCSRIDTSDLRVDTVSWHLVLYWNWNCVGTVEIMSLAAGIVYESKVEKDRILGSGLRELQI